MFFRLMGILICLLLLTPLEAQRRFAVIDPTEDDEELKFDVNAVPVDATTVEVNRGLSGAGVSNLVDLNFSPNIVFSADSSRGFVSYTGANKVLVFDPKSGEILNMLEVGENPGALVLSPDGKTIALVSLLLKRNIPQPNQAFASEEVGGISLIDIETLEVRSVELLKVGFSFANNLLFSQDGNTLYLASALTDEVLRVDRDTLSEVAPRLKVKAGGRPTSITMAPDYSYLTVVLVGSPQLDVAANPDSINFVDLPSFEISKSISPPTGTGTDEPLVHDFSASTGLVISPDGAHGLIVDQRNSGLSTVPELAGDRAWLIDLETREFVKMFRVSGLAARVENVPDGRFLVVSGFELAFIDPVSKTASTLAPVRSNFRPRTKPLFSEDGKKLYIAAPLDDMLERIDIETKVVERLVEIGGEFTVGLRTLKAAPLEMAFTPDGEVLAIVNFNKNTVDLVRESSQIYISRSNSAGNFFTGVAFTNPSEKPSIAVFTGLSVGGVPFTDIASTTDIVEFTNPRDVLLPAGRQFAQTTDELFLAEGDSRADGWIEVDYQEPGLRGFALEGDLSGRRLDGAGAQSVAYRRIIIPEVRVKDGMNTEIAVNNPTRTLLTLTVDLVGPDGKVISTFDKLVGSRGFLQGYLRDLNPDDAVGALFPNSVWENFDHGYLSITASQRFLGSERYFDAERYAVLNGIGLTDGVPLPDEQFFSQVVTFGGNQTYLNLINVLEEPEPEEGEEVSTENTIAATLTLKNSDGSDRAMAALELPAGHAIRRSVSELFGLVDSGEVISGWVLIEADKGGIVGNAELQLNNGKAMTSVPLQSSLMNALVFSHVAQGLGLSTGLALLNPGSELAVAAVQVFNAAGERQSMAEVELQPGRRLVGQLSELVPDFVPQLGGYILVDSSQGLIGLELFYRDDLELISAVLPQ